MRWIVFSDLDGTLLNHHDYRCDEALPVLARLRLSGIPLIPVSSKTVPEMLEWRKELGNTDSFVCENGAIIAIPDHGPCLPDDARPRRREGFRLYYRGRSRRDILKTLGIMRRAFGFEPFNDMSIEDIVRHTGLDRRGAERAARREASEPLLWTGSEQSLERFTRELEVAKLRVIKGGRFVHVMGDTDKGAAVEDLTAAYAHQYGERVHSIGLGDSPNDRAMLLAVDTPVVIPGPEGQHMKIDQRPDTIYAEYPGARGWAGTVDKLLGVFGMETQGGERQ